MEAIGNWCEALIAKKAKDNPYVQQLSERRRQKQLDYFATIALWAASTDERRAELNQQMLMFIRIDGDHLIPTVESLQLGDEQWNCQALYLLSHGQPLPEFQDLQTLTRTCETKGCVRHRQVGSLSNLYQRRYESDRLAMTRHVQRDLYAAAGGHRRWKGEKDKNGYGLVKYHGVRYCVHRMVYWVEDGRWLESEEVVRHLCEENKVKECSERTHITLGSDHDNRNDWREVHKKLKRPPPEATQLMEMMLVNQPVWDEQLVDDVARSAGASILELVDDVLRSYRRDPYSQVQEMALRRLNYGSDDWMVHMLPDQLLQNVQLQQFPDAHWLFWKPLNGPSQNPQDFLYSNVHTVTVPCVQQFHPKQHAMLQVKANMILLFLHLRLVPQDAVAYGRVKRTCGFYLCCNPNHFKILPYSVSSQPAVSVPDLQFRPLLLTEDAAQRLESLVTTGRKTPCCYIGQVHPITGKRRSTPPRHGLTENAKKRKLSE